MELTERLVAAANQEFPPPSHVPTVQALQARMQARAQRKFRRRAFIVATACGWFLAAMWQWSGNRPQTPDAASVASDAQKRTPVQTQLVPSAAIVKEDIVSPEQEPRWTSESPDGEMLAESEHDFRVMETWTAVVPVWVRPPQQQDLQQVWQVKEFRRPVNPRTLNGTEWNSVHRVLYDRGPPPGPRL